MLEEVGDNRRNRFEVLDQESHVWQKHSNLIKGTHSFAR